MDDSTHGRAFRLRTSRRDHWSRSVVICAGVGAFQPNRMNHTPGVEKFEGHGVYYFVQDKNLFRGKHVLIVGGGDTALDWALTFKDWAKHVTLIHRRDIFRAHESSVAALFASPVDVKLFYELKAVHGNDHVEGVTIENNKTQEEEQLDVDAVLINIGFKADLGPIKGWGLDVEKRYIRVNARMETSLAGVFAAGDIASEMGSVPLNLIATGYGQAALAVNCAKHYIDPKAGVFPGHSSEKKF
jgi:thioredoxin reductase (NADPH)